VTREEAFKLGFEAENLVQNPFWKDYPKNPTSEEADLGRWFVDGYVEKCRKQSSTISQ